MNETIKNMINRRSIRKYKTDQISDENLNLILEAGMYAPTGRGMQSPKMVVIQDQNIIKKLSCLNAQVMGVDIDPFYGAPTVILVLANKEISTYREDGSLVLGNLMNAAFSLGIDSCWINRAREVFNMDEGKAMLREWGIDEKYEGIGHCILGYKDVEYPKATPRKEDYIVRV